MIRVWMTHYPEAEAGVAEVFWSRDHTGVAYLICNEISPSHPLISYYRLRSNIFGDGAARLNDLRSNVVRRYNLQSQDLINVQGDPLKWACESRDAKSKFQTNLIRGSVLPELRGLESPSNQRKLPHIE